MAFSGEGATSGAMAGAGAGSAFGPWGAAIGGVAGGLMGGFMGKKNKFRPPNIDTQVDLTKALAQKQKAAIGSTYEKLPEMYEAQKGELTGSLGDWRNKVQSAGSDYLSGIKQTSEESKNALRSALYSSQFGGVPAAMQAVREAGAAGAGVGSGAYLKGVENVGSTLAENLARGEQELQAKGLDTMAAAQTKAFDTFSNVENKIGETNTQYLMSLLDSQRTDEMKRLGLEMGLNEDETQGLIDLYNFRESGILAQENAAAASKGDLLSTLAGTGMQLLAKNVSSGTKTKG